MNLLARTKRREKTDWDRYKDEQSPDYCDMPVLIESGGHIADTDVFVNGSRRYGLRRFRFSAQRNGQVEIETQERLTTATHNWGRSGTELPTIAIGWDYESGALAFIEGKRLTGDIIAVKFACGEDERSEFRVTVANPDGTWDTVDYLAPGPRKD